MRKRERREKGECWLTGYCSKLFTERGLLQGAGLALGYSGQIYDEHPVWPLWNFGSSGFNVLIAS